MKHGKKYRNAVEGQEPGTQFSLDDAIARTKIKTYAKFDESVDVDVNVGIDPSKGDQVVRGSVMLPHGTGKKVRVVVFAKDKHVDEAKAAGADHVGLEDLIDKINAGWTDFEYAVATPDVMGVVGKLAKILGPRGLLPNKKIGTVTFDVAHIIKELKGGRVFFKNDKSAIVHFSLGKVSFEEKALKENVRAFIKALMSAKPPSSKGKFIKKLTVSSSMGVGSSVLVDELIK
ncbi:MAG: large subunit ribosomal protein L1 [Alteromonas naphthalenivorans]|jgi:large subunit ribosomal protein L1